MTADVSQFAGAGLGELGGFAKSALGIAQYIQGNKQLKRLEANRPVYNVNPILQNNANFGFGQQATNYYTDSVNRGLGAGINAILAGGGDLNMINSLVGGATNAYKQYAIADAQQKLQNQGALVNDQRAAWDYNQNIPFQQHYYRAVQQTNSGMTNALGGIQDAAGAVASSGGQGGRQEASSTNPYAQNATNQYQNYYQNRGAFIPPNYGNNTFQGGISPYGNFNPYGQ
jgi:hypothetical protein